MEDKYMRTVGGVKKKKRPQLNYHSDQPVVVITIKNLGKIMDNQIVMV